MKDQRKDQILNAAIKVAEKPGGWANLTRLAVAKVAECSESLPSAHFGTMKQFRRTIMCEAIRTNNYKVIAQGVISGDPVAMKAPVEVRAAALASLTNT